jgi:hypothetical protein
MATCSSPFFVHPLRKPPAGPGAAHSVRAGPQPPLPDPLPARPLLLISCPALRAPQGAARAPRPLTRRLQSACTRPLALHYAPFHRFGPRKPGPGFEPRTRIFRFCPALAAPLEQQLLGGSIQPSTGVSGSDRNRHSFSLTGTPPIVVPGPTSGRACHYRIASPRTPMPASADRAALRGAAPRGWGAPCPWSRRGAAAPTHFE